MSLGLNDKMTKQ